MNTNLIVILYVCAFVLTMAAVLSFFVIGWLRLSRKQFGPAGLTGAGLESMFLLLIRRPRLGGALFSAFGVLGFTFIYLNLRESGFFESGLEAMGPYDLAKHLISLMCTPILVFSGLYFVIRGERAVLGVARIRDSLGAGRRYAARSRPNSGGASVDEAHPSE